MGVGTWGYPTIAERQLMMSTPKQMKKEAARRARVAHDRMIFVYKMMRRKEAVEGEFVGSADPEA